MCSHQVAEFPGGLDRSVRDVILRYGCVLKIDTVR